MQAVANMRSKYEGLITRATLYQKKVAGLRNQLTLDVTVLSINQLNWDLFFSGSAI